MPINAEQNRSCDFLFKSSRAVAFAATIAIANGLTGIAIAAEGAAPQETETTTTSLFGDPGGHRKALSDIGITYGANYIGEVFGNVSGGTARRTVYVGRLEGYTDIDFEKLSGWKGLSFHVNAYQIHGTGLSREYIGNLMAVSYIEALATTRLFELWFEQKLFDDQVAIRFGQLATDAEFFTTSYGAQFINGTFGWPAIMGSDLPSGGAGYPFATPGVRVKFEPTKQLTAMIGVYNGDPVGPCDEVDPQECNRYGTNFRVSDPPLLIGELQYRYNQDKGAAGLAGSWKLGAWHHFGKFDDQRYDIAGISLADTVNAGAAQRHRGNSGIYGIVDHQLWRPASGEPDKGIGLFVRGSASPSDRNVVDLYLDGGLVFAGLIPGRPDDSFGFGLAYARISDGLRGFSADDKAINGSPNPILSHETTFETNYAFQVMPGWMIDADFQYIWNPAGGAVNDKIGQPVGNTAVFGGHTSIKY